MVLHASKNWLVLVARVKQTRIHNNHSKPIWSIMTGRINKFTRGLELQWVKTLRTGYEQDKC